MRVRQAVWKTVLPVARLGARSVHQRRLGPSAPQHGERVDVVTCDMWCDTVI